MSPSDAHDVEITSFYFLPLQRATPIFFQKKISSVKEVKNPGKEAPKIETLIVQFGTFGNKRTVLGLDFSDSLNGFKFNNNG